MPQKMINFGHKLYPWYHYWLHV